MFIVSKAKRKKWIERITGSRLALWSFSSCCKSEANTSEEHIDTYVFNTSSNSAKNDRFPKNNSNCKILVEIVLFQITPQEKFTDTQWCSCIFGQIYLHALCRKVSMFVLRLLNPKKFVLSVLSAVFLRRKCFWKQNWRTENVEHVETIRNESKYRNLSTVRWRDSSCYKSLSCLSLYACLFQNLSSSSIFTCHPRNRKYILLSRIYICFVEVKYLLFKTFCW